MKAQKIVLSIALISSLAATNVFGSELLDGDPKKKSARGGDKVGGGGEIKEIDVELIRDDIAKWIKKGGAKALVLPSEISYGVYVREMMKVLAPGAVSIAFVDQDSKTDPELSVTVDGVEKTCRGFISQRTARMKILCHRGRYASERESNRYALVHHEYAGLARIERNEGADSDYRISKQTPGFLRPHTSLRLAVTHSINKREQLVPVTRMPGIDTITILNDIFVPVKADRALMGVAKTPSGFWSAKCELIMRSADEYADRVIQSGTGYDLSENLAIWKPKATRASDVYVVEFRFQRIGEEYVVEKMLEAKAIQCTFTPSAPAGNKVPSMADLKSVARSFRIGFLEPIGSR